MTRKAIFLAVSCLLAAATAFGQAGSVRLSGWRVTYTGTQVKKGDTYLLKPKVQLYSMMNSGVLEFPSIVLDADKNLKSCGVGTKKVEFLATNGFGVVAKSYQFTEQGLMIAGVVTLPGRDVSGKWKAIDVAFAKRDVPLDADGRISFQIAAPPDFVYDFFGFKIKADEITIPAGGPFEFIRARVLLGDPEQAVDFGTLQFYVYPAVNGKTNGSCDATIALDGRTFSISSCQLGEGTITGMGWFDEGGENAVFHEFTITAAGKVSTNR